MPQYKKSKRKQVRKNKTMKKSLSYKNEKTTTNKTKSHIVKVFLEMLNMIKLYHWKTKTYSQHKATDELYTKMQENVDRFVEVLLGKDENRIQMIEKNMNLLDMNSKEEFKRRL